MTDAPKRIWTAPTDGKCHVGFDTPSFNYTNEYILASEHAALIREAEARGMERAAEIARNTPGGMHGLNYEIAQKIRAAKATP